MRTGKEKSTHLLRHLFPLQSPSKSPKVTQKREDICILAGSQRGCYNGRDCQGLYKAKQEEEKTERHLASFIHSKATAMSSTKSVYILS
jgi:hypothetical protein